MAITGRTMWVGKSPWENGEFPQPRTFSEGGIVTGSAIVGGLPNSVYVTMGGGPNVDELLAVMYIVLGLDTPELRILFSGWYRAIPKTGLSSEHLYQMMIARAYELKFGKDDDQGTD